MRYLFFKNVCKLSIMTGTGAKNVAGQVGLLYFSTDLR